MSLTYIACGVRRSAASEASHAGSHGDDDDDDADDGEGMGCQHWRKRR